MQQAELLGKAETPSSPQKGSLLPKYESLTIEAHGQKGGQSWMVNTKIHNLLKMHNIYKNMYMPAFW